MIPIGNVEPSSSWTAFFIAQTSIEFIGHTRDYTLAKAASLFPVNAITPNPIILDRQLDLWSMSLKRNSDLPPFFRIGMLQRVGGQVLWPQFQLRLLRPAPFEIWSQTSDMEFWWSPLPELTFSRSRMRLDKYSASETHRTSREV